MGSIEIFKLFGSILVDTDDANKSISKTGKETDGLGKKLGSGIKTAGKWALGLAAATAGVATAAFAMTKKVTADFDRIAKDSTKLGVTTDAFQEMEYWAGQNGLSSENMEKAVGRLNQRIGAAAEGNAKYSDALTKLGVNMDDVREGTVSTEDAMYQSISALSEMTNEQEKAALASELFGTKLGRELMPALQDGSLSLEDAAKKAQELGIVIDGDTLSAAETFNDTWDDLTSMMGAFGQKIIAELMPIFQSMMDWIIENMPMIQEVFQTVFDVIGTIFGTAIGWVQSLIAWFGEWYTSNEETMIGIWEIIVETFENILEFLQMTWEFIREFWEEHGQALVESAIEIFGNIYEYVSHFLGLAWEFIQEILGYVVPFVQEMLEKVFAFWNEHGEQIMQAVSNAFNVIKGIIEFIMPYVSTVIGTAWGIISGIFSTTLDVIMGVIRTFSSLFTGDWEGLWNGVKDTTSAIWDGIVQVIKAPINTIIGLANGMINALNGINIKLPKIPDWVPLIGGKGGNEIGFNIPNIPSLAVGGVVHDPTLAMIGDAGAGNPEIVTPEKMLRGIFDESLSRHNGDAMSSNAIVILLEKILRAILDGKDIIINDEVLMSVVDSGLTNRTELEEFMRGRR